MLDCRTTCGGLLRQEGAQALPALSRQFLQGGQRDGVDLPVGWKRMLACPTSHMAVLSDGLMHAPEVGPVQTQHSSPVRLVSSVEQTMDL